MTLDFNHLCPKESLINIYSYWLWKMFIIKKFLLSENEIYDFYLRYDLFLVLLEIIYGIVERRMLKNWVFWILFCAAEETAIGGGDFGWHFLTLGRFLRLALKLCLGLLKAKQYFWVGQLIVFDSSWLPEIKKFGSLSQCWQNQWWSKT